MAFWSWIKFVRKVNAQHSPWTEIYSSDRSEIVWTVSDLVVFNEVAPAWVKRFLAVALETGLRPGGLVRLSRSHIDAGGVIERYAAVSPDDSDEILTRPSDAK